MKNGLIDSEGKINAKENKHFENTYGFSLNSRKSHNSSQKKPIKFIASEIGNSTMPETNTTSTCHGKSL